jgi:acetolactate synthase-1/2/3 large subunit
MNVAQVAAEILKREGVENLLTYPLNPLTETAAAIGIRPIVVRAERVGVHMADAVSRMTSGEKVGVFCCQLGPGIENAFGAVAQAWGEGVPLVVIPGGYPRSEAWVRPNFNSGVSFQHCTKSVETINTPEMIVPALRRAFALARSGRPGPVVVEVPHDMWTVEFAGEIDYVPSKRVRSAPDPRDIDAAAAQLVAAKNPLLYVGQGVHYAKAWDELKAVAELLEAPVCTSLEGKSAFPETHALSLGAGGVAMSRALAMHVTEADTVFGIGASFTTTSFGIKFPIKAKSFIHNSIDPNEIDKALRCDIGLVGDSKLALGMLYEALKERLKKPRGLTAGVKARIDEQNAPWLKQWMPYLTSDAKPMSPYRVINELMQVADVPNTIITHDAGSPRDELSPFWKSVTPLSYIGWGKTTQLGYGLGLALGAKLAKPDKLCINVWGDAAIGMTGMDFETASRCGLPIMSILFNNYRMAMEDKIMAVSKERFASTDISGNYADFAKALGGHSERVTEPGRIAGALADGIKATQEGKAVLLEFITTTEKVYSTFQGGYTGGA